MTVVSEQTTISYKVKYETQHCLFKEMTDQPDFNSSSLKTGAYGAKRGRLDVLYQVCRLFPPPPTQSYPGNFCKINRTRKGLDPCVLERERRRMVTGVGIDALMNRSRLSTDIKSF